MKADNRGYPGLSLPSRRSEIRVVPSECAALVQKDLMESEEVSFIRRNLSGTASVIYYTRLKVFLRRMFFCVITGLISKYYEEGEKS